MPNVWLPGAIQRPGALVGYARGRTRMQWSVVHYTVGRDSTNIGLQGYFHILFPKEGPPVQFAEIDALTWHAGNWNPWGPGAEWERMPTGEYVRPGLQRAEELTPDQVMWGARWFDFCAEWGIPKVHYGGPKYAPADFSGQVNHGDIDPNRSDGCTEEEIAAMFGSVTPPPMTKDSSDMVILIQENNPAKCWLMVGNVRIKDFDGPAGAFGIPQSAIDYAADNIPIKGLNGGQLDLIDKVSKKLLSG